MRQILPIPHWFPQVPQLEESLLVSIQRSPHAV
jgi:hypothetical protein